MLSWAFITRTFLHTIKSASLKACLLSIALFTPHFCSASPAVGNPAITDSTPVTSTATSPHSASHYDSIFAMAMLAIEKGLYSEASELLIHLHERTQSPRLLLELARLYYLAGDYSRSRALFEYLQQQVLLPYGVMQSIDAYLADLETKTPHLALSVGLLTNNNPGNLTHHQEVDILGNTFTLEQSADSQYALGVTTRLQGNWPLSPDGRTSLVGHTQLQDYPSRYFDQWEISAGLSHSTQLAGQAIRLTPQVGKTLYFKSQQTHIGLAAQWHPISNLNTQVNGLLRHENFRQANAFDGNLWQLGLQHTLLNQGNYWLSVDVGLTQAHRQTAENSYTRRWLGGSVGTRFKPWSIRYSTQLSQLNYDAVDPLFDQQRADQQLMHRIDLSYSQKHRQSFSPTLSLVQQQNRSNIAFFDYAKLYLELSFDY